MTSVGDYLKQEREARNLNIREVAELTKISERYLTCIETGDYDQLPPGPYAKGYIAAYARQVCGDERQALALYAEYCTATAPIMDPAAMVGREPEPSAPSPVDPKGIGSPSEETSGPGVFGFATRLRRALPEGGNLRHLSRQGDREKEPLSARVKALIAPLAQWVSKRPRIKAGPLLKKGLLGGFALGVVGILVLAGYGAYYLFFFSADQGAAPSSVQATASPPPAVVTPSAAQKPAETPAPRATVAATPPAARPAQEPAPAPAPAPAAAPSSTPEPDKRVAVAADKTPSVQKESIGTAAEPLAEETPSSEAIKPPTTVAAAPTETGDIDAPKPSITTAASEAISELPLQLIKASVCTAIEDRMPVGVGDRFPWNTSRIYVWSLLNASDPPTKVRHRYYHDGNMVSDVTLKVGSSHWRTWSFHTLSGQHHIGPWHIDIATLDGRVLRRLHFTID